ncbi:MAG: 2Fe-2S iron-sulfur cluster-binding protein [Pseudomonadota bacterium]
MVKLIIDNKPVEAAEGTTVLQAAETVGIHIPRFCYHKHLTIAGNCRLCMVEIEGAKGPVISCKEPVRDGMVVHTDSELAKMARADTLEFVLRNHPLDCPVCDQAGECRLQDYYFDHSLRPSRLVDPKVHKPKALRIGPHVMLDAERCVECSRCVRFCEEVAGVHEIGFTERGDHSTIGIAAGSSLSNPYSLCTVDLCPVGALTSVEFRFKKRVWFLKSTPSICLGCATGCNIWIDHDDLIVYRFRPRANDSVNKEWLCDVGRMTYSNLRPENRILEPQIRQCGGFVAAGWSDAASRVAGLIRAGNASEIVCVLSAGASEEENAALAEFGRGLKDAAKIAWSGADDEPAFGDAILRSVDRNPNRAGVTKTAAARLANLKKGAGYIILNGLSRDDAVAMASSAPAWTAVIASNSIAEGWVDMLLPKATHAEQDGTFINRQGTAQRAAKAFEPLGQSLTVETIVKRLSTALE